MTDTPLDALSRVSRLSRPEVQAIWDEVKANHAKLAGCVKPHDFSIPGRKVGELVRDWQCSKCGGTTESIHKSWYEDGLRDP